MFLLTKFMYSISHFVKSDRNCKGELQNIFKYSSSCGLCKKACSHQSPHSTKKVCDVLRDIFFFSKITKPFSAIAFLWHFYRVPTLYELLVLLHLLNFYVSWLAPSVVHLRIDEKAQCVLVVAYLRCWKPFDTAF